MMGHLEWWGLGWGTWGGGTPVLGAPKVAGLSGWWGGLGRQDTCQHTTQRGGGPPGVVEPGMVGHSG